MSTGTVAIVTDTAIVILVKGRTHTSIPLRRWKRVNESDDSSGWCSQLRTPPEVAWLYTQLANALKSKDDASIISRVSKVVAAEPPPSPPKPREPVELSEPTESLSKRGIARKARPPAVSRYMPSAEPARRRPGRAGPAVVADAMRRPGSNGTGVRGK
jgi:hypothetical protein